jgi:hypothetical protein
VAVPLTAKFARGIVMIVHVFGVNTCAAVPVVAIVANQAALVMESIHNCSCPSLAGSSTMIGEAHVVAGPVEDRGAGQGEGLVVAGAVGGALVGAVAVQLDGEVVGAAGGAVPGGEPGQDP